jgi:septum formation protein
MSPQFILASGSPKRADVVRELGLDVHIQPSDYDEASCTIADPKQRAHTLAEKKALTVHALHPMAYIIGGDSLIESAAGVVYEKPTSAEHARSMLESYRNSYCTSHSGMAIIAPDGTIHSGVHSVRIHWGSIPELQLQAWLDGNVWQGRSGGFKLSGIGQLLVQSIEGEASSVGGFPVYLFGQLLQKHGLHLPDVLPFVH